MAQKTCLQKLREWVKESGLRISDSRLNEFAHILDQKRADLLTKPQFAEAVQKLVQEDLDKFYARQAAADVIAIAAREKAVKIVKDKAFGATAVENMRSWLAGGSLKVGDSVNIDPARVEATIRADLLKLWRRGIEPFKDVAAHGALNREIYQELDAIQRGNPLGQSGSSHALEIAKVINAVQTKILNLKKAYNPFMEKAEDYLIKRFHDRTKVSAVPQEEWVSDAMKAFGEKSFPELSGNEKEKVFQSIYDRIKDGSFGSVMDDSASDKFITVAGAGGNIMKRMARARSLVADDWRAAFDYNQKYGYGSVEQTLQKVIAGASRDIGLMEKFGPNPKGMYEGVYARVHSTASQEEKLALEGSKKSLDRLFDAASGTLDAPARGQLAKWSQGLMTLQYLAKNGSAFFRSMPDTAIAAGMIRGLNGKTVFENAFDIAGEYSKFLTNPESRKTALEDLWMFSHSALRSMAREFGHPDNGAGFIGKMAEAYGPLTLLPLHIESMRAAVGTVISRQLARMADTAHENLPDTWKQGLLRYGIREPEWNTLRQAVQDWGSLKDGTPIQKFTMLNSDGVDRLPDEVISKYLKQSGQRDLNASKDTIELGRKQLGYKLGTLINDHADYGSTTPGTRQRAFMYLGTDMNDPAGIALRMMWQFKSAALTTSDAFRRIYFSGAGLKGDWSGVAQTMAMSMFLWSMGEYSLQALQGKTPEDPRTPSFIAKAVAGSGGLGIMGDIMANEATKQGIFNAKDAILSNLLGPTLGSLAEGAAIGTEYVKSAARSYQNQPAKAPNAAAAKWALSNVPGQNLWAARGAFNFYFANGLKEFLGPGYLGNLESRTNQTPGLLDDRQRYFVGRPLNSPVWPRMFTN